jgi:DNA helicase HerA-like ATPase
MIIAPESASLLPGVATPMPMLPELLLKRLGKNVYRGVEVEVRQAREDRRRHTYILGRTGSGKSYLMANMAIQDVQNGEGRVRKRGEL